MPTNLSKRRNNYPISKQKTTFYQCNPTLVIAESIESEDTSSAANE